MLPKIAHPPTQKEATPAQNCTAFCEKVNFTLKEGLQDTI